MSSSRTKRADASNFAGFGSSLMTFQPVSDHLLDSKAAFTADAESSHGW
jgi:hypothetical protein